MSIKQYVDLSALSVFLDNLKNIFAKVSHTHTHSEITDLSNLKLATEEYVDSSIKAVSDSFINEDDLGSYFFIVETVKEGGTYHLSGITFNEIIEKFNNGGNMVCHVDGTDYIPLLSVTSYQIIFSGIYNTTSVSLVFNTEGVSTLTSTSLASSSQVNQKFTNFSNKITTLEDLVGDGSLLTNAQTIVDSINDLYSKYNAIIEMTETDVDAVFSQ